jgi:cholinesterase
MGVFPTLVPFPWVGAYHGEDVFIELGGFKAFNSSSNPSPAELAAAKFFQNMLATFIRDPSEGLTKQYGWPTYNPNEATLIELFSNLTAGGVLVDPSKYDQACLDLLGG